MFITFLFLCFSCFEQISQTTKQEMPLTGQCALKTRLPYAFLISTFIFFVLPMTLILTLYFLIGLQLRKSSRQMGRTSTTVSTTLSVNTNSHHIHHNSQHLRHNRVNRDYESYSSLNPSLVNQNSSLIHQDCNDNKHHHHQEEEEVEASECDRLTPEVTLSQENKNKKNKSNSSPDKTHMVKSNSLHLPNLSPNHASNTSCSQTTTQAGGHEVTHSRKSILSSRGGGTTSPSNGSIRATSPIRGSSSPAMLTPSRSKLAIFSSPQRQPSSPASHPQLNHIRHHHSRHGSRNVSYHGAGGSSYRQHAASRRAVVKMLGKKKSREGYVFSLFTTLLFLLSRFIPHAFCEESHSFSTSFTLFPLEADCILVHA